SSALCDRPGIVVFARTASSLSRSIGGFLFSGLRAGAGAREQVPVVSGRRVLVVSVPPLVGRRLRVALGRVLPLLLASERGDVEVAPGAAHRLAAATVDEGGAKHPIVVADEGVGAVPLGDAEVGVEVVGQRIPRDQ